MRGLRARRKLWREDGLWPRARQLELEGVAWHCFWRGISRGGGSFGWLAVAHATTFSDRVRFKTSLRIAARHTVSARDDAIAMRFRWRHLATLPVKWVETSLNGLRLSHAGIRPLVTMLRP